MSYHDLFGIFYRISITIHNKGINYENSIYTEFTNNKIKQFIYEFIKAQGFGEIVQCLRALATRTNGLTWISMIHLVKVENKLLKIIL